MIEFRVKNYRCFEDKDPLVFKLDHGFVGVVGPNNSGKSFMLKFFFELRGLWQRLSDRHSVERMISAQEGAIDFIEVLDQAEVFCNLNNRALEISINYDTQASNGVSGVVIEIERGGRKPKITKIVAGGIGYIISTKNFRWQNPPRVGIYTDGVGTQHLLDFEIFTEQMKDLQNSMYIGAFRNALNIGGKDNYYDISIGTHFIQTWRRWRTGPEKEKNDTTQKVTKDIRDIFNYDSLDINEAVDLNTLQVFVDDKSYKLTELGSGIAQFILTLGNIAIKKPAYVFIDEPELHLHPSLQLKFLMMLESYTSKGVMFATHSVGLARSIASTIYSVLKNPGGSARVRDFIATPNLTELLGELSFNSYKDLGFDKVLLVEGITDLRPLQVFLRMLKKDGRVVMIPLGGGAMINANRELELAELMRITPNISALIDSEKHSASEALEAGRQSFVESCRKLGINIKVLDKRAIENYLSDQAVKKIKGPNYRAMTDFEKLSEISPKWEKDENSRIASAMLWTEIKDSDLGLFLEAL